MQSSLPTRGFGITAENATLLEHVATYGEGQALEIRLSPDGRWMAVRSTTGVHLYDVRTSKILELNGSRQLISQMAFSPTGNLLALSLPGTNEIEVWQLPEAQLVHRLTIPGEPSTLLELNFTPQGDKLISSSFRVIDVWRVNDGELIQSLESPEGASFKSTAISGDGTLLTAVVVGNATNGIMAWQVQDQVSEAAYIVGEGDRFSFGQFSPIGEEYTALTDGAEKLFVWQSLDAPHALEIQSSSNIVDFSWVSNTNGYLLATGDTNGELMLWDSTTGKLLTTLPPPEAWSVKLLQADATSDRLVVVYENGSIGLWSLSEGSLGWMINPTAGEVPIQIAIAADGTRFFGVFPSGRLRIWDMQAGRELGTLEELTTGDVRDLAFSPDGKLIAAALENGLVSLWRSDTEEKNRILLDHGMRVNSVAFTPDTIRLATGVGGYIGPLTYDDTVRVWDWANGSVLQQFAGERAEVPSCTVFHNQVAFSPDGSLLASISHDLSVRLWNIKENRIWKTLSGHTQPILDMAMSADGTMLASASLDGTIRLWGIPDGKERRVIKGFPVGMVAVAISPDGKLVAGASVLGVISVWDTASGRLLRTLDEDMNDRSTLAFSQDGSLIAAGKNDALYLWSSQSGKLITKLPGEGGHIVSVTFSNDGELLAYGSDTGLIDLWRAP